MGASKLFVVFVLVFGLTASAFPEGDAGEKPRVEVAFVLDTTGSMSGLIAGAKAKIWYIAEQIVRGKPTPTVSMALVAYRDKGDAYVTKVFDLTDNIDLVYDNLMDFKAQAGGDTPENVNQALHDAVHKLKWSDDPKTLRIIYLVGDSPPHNEYKDVQTYDKTAEEAIKKGIYINTILCGGNQNTKKIWIQIADAAEGSFFAIDQSGGVKEIPTPFDIELAKLNRELTGTVVAYGSAEERKETLRLGGLSDSYKPASAASKAGFAEKSGKVAGGKDLVKDLDEEGTELDGIKEDELPDEMKKMTAEERKKYITEKQAKRKEISKKIRELSAKRNEYIKKELEKTEDAKSGFDYKVIEALKKKAEKKGIKYED